MNLPAISDSEGRPCAFAKIDIYEAGPDGKHLLSVTADKDGQVPPILVEADTVKVVASKSDGLVVYTMDDVRFVR